jgi:hypothetical protein
MRKLRITGDGTPAGTKIIDTETGKDISNIVRSVIFRHSVESLPEAEIEVIAPEFDFVVNEKIPENQNLLVLKNNHKYDLAKYLPGKKAVTGYKWFDSRFGEPIDEEIVRWWRLPE